MEQHSKGNTMKAEHSKRGEMEIIDEPMDSQEQKASEANIFVADSQKYQGWYEKYNAV